MLYKTSKKVLKFKNNSAEFLNGLTANEMSRPRNAFVNIHGKIIAVFDQAAIDEEEHWVILEPQCVDILLGHLDKYVKLSGVKVEVLAKNVYFDLEGNYQLSENDVCIPQKKGRLIVTDSGLKADASDEQFTLFRVQNDISVQGVDFNDEFLLNVSMTDLVSFKKGCFLGQEPISKVYNRSKPSWKLTVKDADECSEDERQKMTSVIKDPDSGKMKGFVFISNK